MAIPLSDLRIVRADPSQHDVSGFNCGDDDLDDFLKNDCFKYQAEYLSQTRLFYYQEQLAGYLTLLTDSITLETKEKKGLFSFHRQVVSFPALKIGRIAIARTHQRKGLGRELIKYTLGIAVRMNDHNHIGARFITLDAYPASIPFYERCGFVFNKHKDYKKRREAHPSMRYDVIKGPQL